MKNQIDISVIIPVYNAGALIDRCLDSVFNQAGDLNIEVVLVDDGSTDNSVDLIRARKEQDRIRLFQQKNSGPSKARNKGIMEATGKYIAFLDADDYWMPEFLGATFKFLEAHADCVAVSVAQRHLTVSGEYESPRNWTKITLGREMVPYDIYKFWADNNHICTGSILIRSTVAKDTGGQREDLRICEDLEYWALIASYGHIGFIPQILFVSDGSKVTESVGWVQKHLPRWNAAVSVEEWQKRLVEKVPALLSNKSFLKARGRIGRNLAYSLLLSKRYGLAKQQIKKFGKTFPKDKMSWVLRIGASNPLFWLIVSRALVRREYNRD